jgi:hydrogenase maturation factor
MKRSTRIVDLDRIAVHPHTARLCAHFGLRPLGLIASGSLLLTIAGRRAPALLGAFRRRRVPAAVIGAVASGRGVDAYRAGRRVAFQWSPRDELTRLR